MWPTHWKIWLLLGAIGLVAVPGCSGCREDPVEAQKRLEEEKRKKEAAAKKKKKKPDFEIGQLRIRPCPKRKQDPNRDDKNNPGKEVQGPTRDAVAWWYKPGHWTSTALYAKTNNFNFVGELDIAVTDREGDPIPHIATPFRLKTQRQVALPKGQAKDLESILFAPPTGRSARADYDISGNRGGNRGYNSLLVRMPSYQYHLVVMARLPERYGYLKNLDAIKRSLDPLSNQAANGPYYRITMMSPQGRPSLPSNSLAWTSIACMLWDDAEPDLLDPVQQQSMLDWLHWGGQLVVSGPDTLDTLNNSFLAPYLPATSTGVRELARENLAELRRWSGNSSRALEPARPWTGVKLKKHTQSQFVPGTNELLVERRVGLGRVVVSAFRLSGRELSSWAGFDGFFNACLLRRPARKFRLGNELQVMADPVDGSRSGDAATVCKLRYFSRDTGVEMSSYGADVLQFDYDEEEMYGSGTYSDYSYTVSPSMDSSAPGPGVAAWNDFNPVADTARESLRKAAGIEVPDRQFVVWIIAGYLLVLVPVNWAVFRALGRVEWAWAAAPLIAIGCAGLVIKLAQLDIGFARARNEVAVVELQPGYSRAHVTRYTSLYCSLATNYDFKFSDSGGVLLPFPSVASPDEYYLSAGQGERELTYRRDKKAAVEGFYVGSNSIGFAHSEQMLDLGGSITIEQTDDGGHRVVNNTNLTLQGAGVVKRVAGGGVRTAWIGTLDPGESAPLELSLASLGNSISSNPPDEQGHKAPARARSWEERWWEKQREESRLSSSNSQAGDLNLRRLLDVAQNFTSLEPDQMRLIGWVDQEIPGLAVDPLPPQSRHAAVVVAELAYGFGKAPSPDLNSKSDVEKAPLPASQTTRNDASPLGAFPRFVQDSTTADTRRLPKDLMTGAQ